MGVRVGLILFLMKRLLTVVYMWVSMSRSQAAVFTRARKGVALFSLVSACELGFEFEFVSWVVSWALSGLSVGLSVGCQWCCARECRL